MIEYTLDCGCKISGYYWKRHCAICGKYLCHICEKDDPLSIFYEDREYFITLCPDCAPNYQSIYEGLMAQKREFEAGRDFFLKVVDRDKKVEMWCEA